MHTDGPWNEDAKHTGGARAIIGDGQQLVALVYGKTPDEQSANARAVSAARDFMEAAAMMTAAEQAGGDMWWRGFNMLKDAYKKAGGQFPSMDETGTCRQGDRCVCGGDTQQVRASCANWVR